MTAQAWAECAAVTTLAALQADLVTWACSQLYLQLSPAGQAAAWKPGPAMHPIPAACS